MKNGTAACLKLLDSTQCGAAETRWKGYPRCHWDTKPPCWEGLAGTRPVKWQGLNVIRHQTDGRMSSDDPGWRVGRTRSWSVQQGGGFQQWPAVTSTTRPPTPPPHHPDHPCPSRVAEPRPPDIVAESIRTHVSPSWGHSGYSMYLYIWIHYIWGVHYFLMLDILSWL